MNDEKPRSLRLAVMLTTTSAAVSSVMGLMMITFSAETRPLPRIGALALAITAVVAETLLLFKATEAIEARIDDEHKRDGH